MRINRDYRDRQDQPRSPGSPGSGSEGRRSASGELGRDGALWGTLGAGKKGDLTVWGATGDGVVGPCEERRDTEIFWGALRRVGAVKGTRRGSREAGRVRDSAQGRGPTVFPPSSAGHRAMSRARRVPGRGAAMARQVRVTPGTPALNAGGGWSHPPLLGLLEIPPLPHHFRGSLALDLGVIPCSGFRDPLAPSSALSPLLRWGCWRILAWGRARGMPVVTGTRLWRLSCCCCWGAGRLRRRGIHPRHPSKVNPPPLPGPPERGSTPPYMGLWPPCSPAALAAVEALAQLCLRDPPEEEEEGEEDLENEEELLVRGGQGWS